MFYRVLKDMGSTGKIFMPANLIAKLKYKNINIYAGLKMEGVKLEADDRLPENRIRLSRDVMDKMGLPENINYQIMPCMGGICIGPVIGLLMSRTKRGITERFLHDMLDYTLPYGRIGGLLCIMSLNKLDFKNKLIEGYYYNPGTGRKWIKAVLPFPSTIYRRVILPKYMELKLKRATGNCIFNTGYFNKWEFWKMASRSEYVKKHIPHTIMYDFFGNVEDMLDKYGSVYLKPVFGTLARGLIKIDKKDGYYYVKNKVENIDLHFGKSDEAKRYVNRYTGRTSYIIQQAITPLRINDRSMDFRVVMQKDETKKWICTGIVGFLGIRGNICSNWGLQAAFEDLLSKAAKLSTDEIAKLRKEVINVCTGVCRTIESSGENYGDLGFDILIDSNLKIWVLEVNKRHFHVVPLWMNDTDMYYRIKSNPVKYAAALSGFEVSSN
ncbi:MAG: YheC/YheD family protein [Clostridiales bacterium]|nr:YheC/YheD family protein [Clostridiales bacterium]